MVRVRLNFVNLRLVNWDGITLQVGIKLRFFPFLVKDIIFNSWLSMLPFLSRLLILSKIHGLVNFLNFIQNGITLFNLFRRLISLVIA